MSDDWSLAEERESDELVRLHYFAVRKERESGEPVEFHITVRERAASRGDQSLRFFAVADKQTNQCSAPFTPSGWGDSLLKALRDCVRAVHRFPYEPAEDE